MNNEFLFAKGSSLPNLIEREGFTKSIQIVEEKTKKGVPFTMSFNNMDFNSSPLGILRFQKKMDFRVGFIRFDVNLKSNILYRLIQQFY